MAKKKKAARARVKADTERKSRRDSRKPDEPVDKKIQRQIYITQGLIDDLEALRAVREAAVREKQGLHCSVSWSAFVGSTLHEVVRKARKAGTI